MTPNNKKNKYKLLRVNLCSLKVDLQNLNLFPLFLIADKYIAQSIPEIDVSNTICQFRDNINAPPE